MTLVLPHNKAIAFLEAENQIITAKEESQKTLPEQQQGMIPIYYSVQPGDFLHKIAIRYGCTVGDICRWNNMTGKNILAGTRLLIWTQQENANGVHSKYKE
jgi:membrane-bound lytic murein transglycosylase D